MTLEVHTGQGSETLITSRTYNAYCNILCGFMDPRSVIIIITNSVISIISELHCHFKFVWL